MERLQYVDVFRGVAILIMVLYHFVNALSSVNVYTDWPYFFPSIGLITLPSPSFLFLAVSGMSVYLLVRKRQRTGWGTNQIVTHVTERYGRYLLISIPFTWLLWGLDTWMAWEEALQGIALTVIVLGTIHALRSVDMKLGVVLVTVCALVQGYRHKLLETFLDVLPGMQNPLLVDLGSAAWNAFAGGFFSITALLPYAVAGIIMIRLLYEEETSWRSVPLGVAALTVAFALVLFGFSIGFYVRDIPITFYGVATVFLTYYVLFRAWNRWPGSHLFELLAAYGRQAFLVYIGTWIFLVRPIERSALAEIFPHAQAFVISALLIVGTVLVTARYDAYRAEHGPVSLQLLRRLV